MRVQRTARGSSRRKAHLGHIALADIAKIAQGRDEPLIQGYWSVVDPSLSRYLFFLLDEWRARAFHRAEGSAKQKSCTPFIARMQLRKCSLSVPYFSEAI